MGRGRKTVPGTSWQSVAGSIVWEGPRLIVPVGLPGSGKSTWAHWIQQTKPVQIISADQIRLEIWDSLEEANSKRQNHKRVFEEMHLRIRFGLQNGKIVIADATNLYRHAREPLYEIALQTGSPTEIVLFGDPETALRQNRLREADRVVPDEAMERMSLLLPDLLGDLQEEGPVHLQ